ncbi:MAG TPA: TetR/AcrR family transcriptional regulator [Pseudomonadales bacterium]|jgi:AcrR family transcriptional regulator
MSQRERKKRQSRRQWLQAGRACFIRDGYAGSSVAQIAAEAGLSRPGFFLYFASKAALRQAIALECLQVWITMAGQELERGGGYGLWLDRSLLRIHQQIMDAAPLLMAAGVLTVTTADDDAPLAAAWDRLVSVLLDADGAAAIQPLRRRMTAGLLQGAWQSLMAAQADEPQVRKAVCDWLDRTGE